MDQIEKHDEAAQAPGEDVRTSSNAFGPQPVSQSLPLRPKESGSLTSRAAAVEDEQEADEPLTADNETNMNQDEHGTAEDQDYGEVTNVPPLQPKKKKKRSKRKPQSQRGLVSVYKSEHPLPDPHRPE